MRTKKTSANAPPITFDKPSALVRILTTLTPEGARLRLTMVGGRTRDVRLVDVHAQGEHISIDVIPHEPTDARYISSQDRPPAAELERVDLANVAGMHVL